MAYRLRNLGEVEKIDCPCGWSRRPFADHPAYATASLHGTIFSALREALPHRHAPADGREATHETYMVTDECTHDGALIYWGNGAVEARPGTVAYVPPGTVHGGLGNFTPLILGSPGFSREGTIEVDDPAIRDAIIRESRSRLIFPPEYGTCGGLFQLTAEDPAMSFSQTYGHAGLAMLVAQTMDDRLFCGAVPHDRLAREGFRKTEGPTYLTVLGGEGNIEIGGEAVGVREMDALLLEAGTPFSLDKRLFTAIMTVHPQAPEALVRK